MHPPDREKSRGAESVELYAALVVSSTSHYRCQQLLVFILSLLSASALLVKAG